MAGSLSITFAATLRRPAKPGKDTSWAFLVLPKTASEKLPRRGRTSVVGVLNGVPFQATLDPDGQLGHWLRVSDELREAAHSSAGETVTVQISPADPAPEPRLPDDLRKVLATSSVAMATWQDTSTIARVDWIHWLDSAKQATTRQRRVANAGDMLASGKKRVCCFDPSGYYSKGLSAPEPAA